MSFARSKALSIKLRGFTMIELLCVMVIIANLGVATIGQYIDLQKDAKAAVLRKNLNIVRTAIRNQLLQAKLKCGYNNSALPGNPPSTDTFTAALEANDITVSLLCTTAQIPNPADRRFFDNVAPTNPFYVPSQAAGVTNYTFRSTRSSTCNASGVCCFERPASITFQWGMLRGSGPSDDFRIFATTDTPGVMECAW